MSQYPSPYSAPESPNPYDAYGSYGPDPRRPARRASIMMLVLGGLSLLCGVCIGVVSTVDFDQLQGPQAGQLQQMQAEVQALYDMPLSSLLRFSAVVVLVPSILFIVLGFLVWRGGLGAVITSTVFTSLAILLQVLLLGATLLGSADVEAGRAENVLSMCLVGAPLILLVLLLVWLIQAAKAAPHIRTAEAQYQAQYWQYQQQQQAYRQGNYPPPPGTPPTASPPGGDRGNPSQG